MKVFSVVLIAFLFIGCSVKEVSLKDAKQEIVIQDLVNIPQNIEYYTSHMKYYDEYYIDKEYEKSYFSMWNTKKPEATLEDVKWPFKYFDFTKSYGENLLPIKKSFFDEMYNESNFDNYLKISSKAVTLKYSNIRALPTSRPLLKDPSLAGEGFPFDYLQNSSINANAPILVSHYSKDKQWAFIFSSFTYGWIKSDEIVLLEDKYASTWKNAKQIYIVKEGIPLFTESGKALFNTRIGMMFALVGEDENNYIMMSISKYKNNKPMFHKTKILKKYASLKPLPLNKDNINNIINEVSKTNYGWGGVYGQRDCSSMLMDIYSSFGIFLPRNSSKQAEIGKVIDLSSLDDELKIKTIKEQAVPFETFLYKQGHIVLYVGVYDNKIIVFHNTWGIKTKEGGKEGRFIIGKPIFSTLKLGHELKNYNEDAELLRNIKSMNIITR